MPNFQELIIASGEPSYLPEKRLAKWIWTQRLILTPIFPPTSTRTWECLDPFSQG